MSEEKSNKEKLAEKVVAMVVDFINTEGGISLDDLYCLFGPPDSYYIVAAALGELQIVKTDWQACSPGVPSR